MKLRKVIETLGRRIDWLEQKLDTIDDKSCPAWNWLHQEYIALQEAVRIVAEKVATESVVKASARTLEVDHV